MQREKPLTVLADQRAAVALLERHIRELGDSLVILEAGCGRRWPLQLADLDLHVIGIDMDAEALAARRDLESAVVGDLRDASLVPPHSCDVVYSSFVLEHVAGAERALENFLYWLRPGGLLILRVPDRDSAYGFGARTTPFWLHVLEKRWLEGHANAGKPGFDPYPVYYDPVVSRTGMRSFCQRHGCSMLEEYGTGFFPPGPGGAIQRTVLVTLWGVSFSRLAWRHKNLTYVIRGPGERVRSASVSDDLRRSMTMPDLNLQGAALGSDLPPRPA